MSDFEYPTFEIIGQRRKSYEALVSRISRPPPEGHSFVPFGSSHINWAPLLKPLSACRVGLISTAGVHMRKQRKFDVDRHEGDWSCRVIDGDIKSDDIVVTHTHYDTRDAIKDPNVIFPVDRMKELVRESYIGELAPKHYGFMGFVPDPRQLLADTVPGVIDDLVADQVDVVLLTGG